MADSTPYPTTEEARLARVRAAHSLREAALQLRNAHEMLRGLPDHDRLTRQVPGLTAGVYGLIKELAPPQRTEEVPVDAG